MPSSYSSSDEESRSGSTKYFRIRNEHDFQSWQLKTLAKAREKGFETFLTTSTQDHTQADIEAQQNKADAESDATKKYVEERKLKSMLVHNKKRAAATNMMINSVRGTMAKRLATMSNEPHDMYEAICKRFGNKDGDRGLSDLKDAFDSYKLKAWWRNPEDYFANLEWMNEEIRKYDPAFAATKKALVMHVLRHLGKPYKQVKSIIMDKPHYIDDYDSMKLSITNFWNRELAAKAQRRNRRKTRNKKKRQARRKQGSGTYRGSSDDSSSSSSEASEESDDESESDSNGSVDFYNKKETEKVS